MANKEHLRMLRHGAVVWNIWRKANPDVTPLLEEVNLNGVNLDNANLSYANLERADLSDAVLRGAELHSANLKKANLSYANLDRATLIQADMTNANLCWAHLDRTNLFQAYLEGASLNGAYLEGADLGEATLNSTGFTSVDLSQVYGLDTIKHLGPSPISIDTLYQSKGKIPEIFLRGCGVPDAFIEYLPSLLGTIQPIQFYSCFISHSTKDEEFAKRLHSRMRDNNLRVWFAPEDMKGGQKLHEQIDQAIRVHDKLVLVLSEESIQSPWVETEIRKARKAELRGNRRKLFPIRLVNFDTLRDWECFDADTGKDLAVEVREYFIPDFTLWKDHDAFESAFAKLLEDLKATEAIPVPT